MCKCVECRDIKLCDYMNMHMCKNVGGHTHMYINKSMGTYGLNAGLCIHMYLFIYRMHGSVRECYYVWECV